MANETLYSSNIVVAAGVDAEISPWFTSSAIMPGLVAAYNPIGNTNAHRVPISGSVTASVVAEGTAATAQTVTDTSVLLTLQKAVVVTKPTAEALKFADGANPTRHAKLAATACAKKFDQDCLALAASLSQSVDSSTSLTVAKLQEAAYTVRLGDMPSDRMAAVLGYKSAYQLMGDVRAATGSFYANPNANMGNRGDNQQGGGRIGNMFGVELFETSNIYTDTTPTPDDFFNVVFCPEFWIGALFPSGNAPSFESAISEDVGFLESVTHIKTTMWYQVAELRDAAGCILKVDI